jgi:hypothetical protein
MPKTVWATFSQGKVELSEPITVHQSLVAKTIGKLADSDAEQLDRSIQIWLGR